MPKKLAFTYDVLLMINSFDVTHITLKLKMKCKIQVSGTILESTFVNPANESAII